MKENQPVIRLENVGFRYNSEVILKNITLEVPERDFLAIIGPNGSGKTTLIKLILGLLSPTAGKVKVLGHSPAEARRWIGYVPQSFSFDRDFPINVLQTVLMGRLNQAPTLGGYSRKDIEAAEEAMAHAEISNLRKQMLGTLSGGQLQRVLIARALASRPELLLLDEPTASVDTRVEKDIYELLSHLNEQTTILLVTHDLGFVSSYVNKVACLNRSLVCHPTTRLSAEVIEDLYEAPVHLVRHDQDIQLEDKQ